MEVVDIDMLVEMTEHELLVLVFVRVVFLVDLDMMSVVNEIVDLGRSSAH